VKIAENGDADSSVDYSLSSVDRIVVFIRIPHFEERLEQALEDTRARKYLSITRSGQDQSVRAGVCEYD
jgi:hypothetical protein